MASSAEDAAAVPSAMDQDEAVARFAAVVDQLGEGPRAPAPKYAKKAWFILDRDQFPRKQCISIISTPLFDQIILFLIALNCVTMMVFNEPVLNKMMEGHPDDYWERSTWPRTWARLEVAFRPLGGCTSASVGPCSFVDWLDFTFLVLFAIEMCLKMISQGLALHPNSYLRSGWNWLDFIVVIIGFVEMLVPGLPGVSTLRLFKTLRPLRSLQRIRGMRVLVQTILEAVPQLCNVLFFLFFIIFFFALFGIALFKSGLRYTCHTTSDNGTTWESTDDICRPYCTWDEMTVRLDGACLSLGPTTFQQERSYDTFDWTYSCRQGQECRCSANGLVDPTCSFSSNPNYGITSFDSLPWALVSLFQAISLEGWVDMMYQLQDGVSSWVWTYFVMLVLIGAIIVINLFLAVLCDNFEMADRDGDEKVKEEAGADVVARELEDLKHSNPIRQAVLNLIKHRYFDIFVQSCIIFNTLIMASKYLPCNTSPLRPQPELFAGCVIDGVDVQGGCHSLFWSDFMPFNFFLFGYVTNIVLTVIFTLESVLKIFALGPRLFAKDQMNLFDLVVVIFSLVDIAFDVLSRMNIPISLGIPFSVLRAFRIFRLFKLVRAVPQMRKILNTLITSISSVGYLALLLGLMIIIFILLGMELFGGYYPRPEFNYTAEHFPNVWKPHAQGGNELTWDDEPSRYHFDDPGNALLAIFVVLSGENWNEIMFHSHEATFQSYFESEFSPMCASAIVYFMLLFVVGNLLLFNLFIAILLSNFEDDEEEEEELEADDLIGPDDDKGGKADASMAVNKKQEVMMEWRFNMYIPIVNKSVGLVSAAGEVSSTRKSEGGENGGHEEEDDDKPPANYPANDDAGNGDRSLKVFSWSNPVRQASAHLISTTWFELVIVAMICISTVLMLFDMPHLKSKESTGTPTEAHINPRNTESISLEPAHPLRIVIDYVNTVFAFVFLAEMLVKWVAQGVVRSKTPKEYVLAKPYFYSGWNWLDFFIVVISLVSMSDVEAIKPLKALRALRPLRLVSRNEDLRITVTTLFESVPAMGSLISVSLLFFVIFGILGIELFGGKLGYCMDPNYDWMEYGSRVIPGMNGVQNDYEECMTLPRYNLTRRTTHGILFADMIEMCNEQWSGQGFKHQEECEEIWLSFTEFPQWLYPHFGYFDNLKLSMLLLFEVSALEGWPDVMHVAMDSDADSQYVVPWRVPDWMGGGLGGVGVPMQAHTPQWQIASIFFILWIILGCFVVVNMTVGVVVDTFSKIKAENDGLLLMSEEQADWVKAQKQLFAQRPLVQASPPTEPWRLNVYYLVTSTKFELLVMGVILANMLQMGCDWWEPAYQECLGDQCPEGVSHGDPNFPQIQHLKQVVSVLNYIFLTLYWIEMVIKWIGLGPLQYFKNKADCFDCFLVCVSTAEVVITQIGIDNVPAGVVRVFRLFRVMRLVRILKTAKSLRTVIMTVYISIPQLKNIMLLISLIIIIFDVLCVQNFYAVNYTPGNFDPSYQHLQSQRRGEVMPNPDEDFYYSGDGTNWGDQINRHANFQYWWVGALTLVRASTGESFNLIMHDLYDWQWGHNRLTCCPECGPIVEGPVVTYNLPNGDVLAVPRPVWSCGSTGWAVFIYLVFQVLMAYIVLSIMIGVILENFTNVGSETRKIRMDDLEEFREVWLKYDPKGTFIVPSHNLLAILQQLKQPLGIAGAQPALTRAEMLKHLGKLDIPDHGGYIHFMETLTAVSHHAAGVPVPVCDTTKKMQKAAQQVPKLRVLDKPAHNALTNYLVSLLQSRWRGYAMRKMYEDDPAGAEAALSAESAAPAVKGKIKANQVAPSPPES